jgi:hypothetical protein
MKALRLRHILGPALTLAGQVSGPTAAQDPPPATRSPTAVEDEAVGWSFSFSAYTYFVPEDGNYAQPTVTADRDWLHLEARYNYEDRDTGSLWMGYNFSGGDGIEWEITPMLGGVFGETSGIAPGYKGYLSWKTLEAYSEGEYVFDVDDSSGSFFYNWSELTLAPADWLRVGLVAQRTRVYETDLDVQRGLLVGFSYKKVGVTAHLFNPDESDSPVVVSVSLDL